MRTKGENSVQFDGLYNFRDIGGFKTNEGRRMKKGILFRSDELSRLTQNDIEVFDQLKIKLICDLRTEQEQKSKPSKLNSENGVQVINISIQDKSQEFTHFEFFKFLVCKSNSIKFEQLMKDMYHSMAFINNSKINEIITLLSQQNNIPALIHCTGGKDCTGFISAIIQLLVGVPYKIVMEEYLFSNDLIAPKMKKIEKMIKWMSLFQLSTERVKPILEVRQEYLEDVYNEIIIQYGDIETYLCKACKIQKRSLSDLKNLLLE
ncbi:tyrosine-protein phosphatase [Lysinibacillus sp. 1P01SD]|uniref:tyrosine-protein phosphatase n=1 Tax=Lysinibacillus sp. 1P01SD TaxID=3132285 RepID=UPI0039A089D5